MADGRPKDAAPSDDAEEATEATEEAPGAEDTPSIDEPARSWRLKWDERKPSPATTVELRVPANAYFFFKDYELKDIKALRPRQPGPNWTDKKATGELWKPLKASLDNFYAQPWRWDGDGHVIVTEQYKTSCKGFPGDLHSAKGSQGLYRPIRSHLLSETADLDMKMAMQTILLWVFKRFGIETPHLEYYVKHRDAVLDKFMRKAECSRPYAKEQFTIAWTSDQKMRGACTNSKFHTAYDAEAKEVMKEAMKLKELQWIIPFLDPEGAPNRAGSFIAKLFHFVQAPLLLRVRHLIEEEEGERVACIVFDGLNVANVERRGDEPLLARCTASCEEVCPGINMGWAWKELDFEVRTKDTKVRVPDKAVGRVLIVDGKLRIPDDYKPPEPPGEDAEGEGGGGGGGDAADAHRLRALSYRPRGASVHQGACGEAWAQVLVRGQDGGELRHRRKVCGLAAHGHHHQRRGRHARCSTSSPAQAMQAAGTAAGPVRRRREGGVP